MTQHDLAPASSSETYSPGCQDIFSAHHRFWYTAGAGSLVYTPNLGIEQTLIDGRIDCVTAIECLAASTDDFEWREPTQPIAAEVRSLRHPFPPSIDERLKGQFGEEGYLLLSQFFLALRHSCQLSDSRQWAGIEVITDTKPVPANTLCYQLNPYYAAFWNHVKPYLDRYGRPIGELQDKLGREIGGIIVVEPLSPCATAHAKEAHAQRCERFRDWVKVVKACIESLRTEVRSDRFRQTLKDYLKPSREMYRETIRYIEHLFAVHGELLILRLDLGYQPEDLAAVMSNTADTPVMPDTSAMPVVRGHRKDLLTRLQKHMRAEFTATGPELNGLCGYAMRLYHIPEVGYHFHVMLVLEAALLDPEQRETERLIVSLTEAVGQLWVKTITRGIGVYFPYHLHRQAGKSRFGFRSPYQPYQGAGIGRHSPRSASSMADIERAISFMCLTDYFQRLKLPPKQRAFFKGQRLGRGSSAAVCPAQRPHPKNTSSANGLSDSTGSVKSASTRNADAGDRLGSASTGGPNAPPPLGRGGRIALNP